MNEETKVPQEMMGGGIDAAEYIYQPIGRPPKEKNDRYRKVSTTLPPRIHEKILRLRLRWSDLIIAGLFHEEHCNDFLEKLLAREEEQHREIEQLRKALAERNLSILSDYKDERGA